MMSDKGAQHLLEKRGLARARARHQANSKHAGAVKTLAKLSGNDVILLEQVLANLDQPGFCAHWISSATTSNSRPLTIWPVGVPHAQQASSCIDIASQSSWHFGQWTTSGVSSI